MTNRRQFLRAGVGVGAAWAAASWTAQAIDPFKRNGKPHLRLSLAGYSYRKYLGLNIKPKPPMTLLDFARHAADMNLDAIEPTAYYFSTTSPEFLAQLKGACTKLGLDISGSAVGNDFCVADPAKLKQQIASVKKWTEHTAFLGGKTLRIFAGRVPKGDTEAKARARCIEAIQEACDHAGKFGVMLALENHGGIVATGQQMLSIVKAVKHQWFGVNLDTGNFHTQDPYADMALMAPYSVNVQIKTELRREGSKKEEADLNRIIDILRSANYRGYVALEYEAAEEPKAAVPKYVAKLKEIIG